MLINKDGIPSGCEACGCKEVLAYLVGKGMKQRSIYTGECAECGFDNDLYGKMKEPGRSMYLKEYKDNLKKPDIEKCPFCGLHVCMCSEKEWEKMRVFDE